MLCLRPGNQHRWRHNQIHPPKLLMSGDVLRRNAFRPLTESIVITSLLLYSQLTFRMPVEIGSIAPQREHEQQLGVHAGGREVGRFQSLDRRSQGFAQGHRPISTQEPTTIDSPMAAVVVKIEAAHFLY